MFDTFEAAKLLGLRKKSLAFLLSEYCCIESDKSLRLSDWRMRPLREELLVYARMDTHYLLYIFDKMSNLLIEKTQKLKLNQSKKNTKNNNSNSNEAKDYLLMSLANSEETCLQMCVIF